MAPRQVLGRGEMLTITLPEGGLERHYETRLFRELVAENKVRGRLLKCSDARYFNWGIAGPGPETRKRDSAEAEKVDQTWADDDTEIILWSGMHARDPDIDHRIANGASMYWLSPRPNDFTSYFLEIAIQADEESLKIDVGLVGDGAHPDAVRIDNLFVGAPPFIIPVGHSLVLESIRRVGTKNIAVCSDCECFHPRSADCSGPAAK